MVRVLFPPPPCDPFLFPTWCHFWVEFVVGSYLALRVFLAVDSLVFLPPQKPTSPNTNSTRIEDPHESNVLDPSIFFSKKVWHVYE